MTRFLRDFASTSNGRRLLESSLQEANRAIEKARSQLSDINDASAHGDEAERVIMKTYIQRHIYCARSQTEVFLN